MLLDQHRAAYQVDVQLLEGSTADKHPACVVGGPAGHDRQ